MPHAQAALDIDDTCPTSTDALIHMGDAFFGGVELFAIPMLVAAALASLRYGVLPRWYGWACLVLALILAIPPIGWLGVFVGVPLWVFVTSVLLFGKAPRERVAAPESHG